MSFRPDSKASILTDSAEGKPLELRVHKVCQTSSGGDHVTIYEADVAFAAGEVRVELANACPGDADPVAVESAREAIRRGAEAVLRPRGQGAMIRVGRIVIHPVDFKPRRFEEHTAEELRRLLADGAERVAAVDGPCE